MRGFLRDGCWFEAVHTLLPDFVRLFLGSVLSIEKALKSDKRFRYYRPRAQKLLPTKVTACAWTARSALCSWAAGEMMSLHV